MHWACYNGNLDLVRYLVEERGADLTAKGNVRALFPSLSSLPLFPSLFSLSPHSAARAAAVLPFLRPHMQKQRVC